MPVGVVYGLAVVQRVGEWMQVEKRGARSGAVQMKKGVWKKSKVLLMHDGYGLLSGYQEALHEVSL